MHPTKHVLYANSSFSSSDDELGLTVEGELEGREEEILCQRAREREHGRETEHGRGRCERDGDVVR